MGAEIRRKCKDCDKDVVVSEKAYQLMLERGESLPERCDVCRLAHASIRRPIKCPYFQPQLESVPPSVSWTLGRE
jgi:hypothetical protein